jgi:hypothetical protein
VKHPKHAQTKAQHAASVKWAKAGRAAQARKRAFEKAHGLPTRTKSQKQASLKWAAAGRASQARKRQGLQPVARQKPALALPGYGIHDLPVCAATGVAEHLLAAAGICVPDAAILGLAARAPGGCLPDYLEQAAAGGLCGVRLAGFWPCDPDVFVPGLLYGVQFRQGYHAVLSCPSGMISWGMLMPVTGVPVEAWHLEWDTQLS